MPQTFQGTHLKLSLILLSVFISTFAYADLAEFHQKNCDAPEAKKFIGTNGSCRIVIAPKALETMGQCTGNVFGDTPCTVTYVSNKGGAAMNLTCGEDLKNPVINQDMDAKGVSYNVATILTKENQKETIVNDKNDYKIVSNPALKVILVGTDASIILSLENGSVPFTDVKCN